MKNYKFFLFISLLIAGSVFYFKPTQAITAQADTTAPGSPKNINAFPATKTASDRFIIFWDNPTDPSSIENAWYKFDDAPTSNTDGLRFKDVSDPDDATLGLIDGLETGGRTTRTCYIWLEDGVGNKDYTTAVSVVLRPEGATDKILRVAGADRYATAIATSKKIFPEDQTASAVVLTNGGAMADALAGAPLAFKANAPILLIKKDSIPWEVFQEITRVLPTGKKIYVLGGTGVINETQVNTLKSKGFSVERIAGANRMATSIKILEKLDSLKGEKPTKIFLVNGYAMADAMSAAPVAAFLQEGIALTERGDLSQVVRDYFNTNLSTITTVTIAGGTTVVPGYVEDLFKNAGYVTERIGGNDRYETSRLFAQKMVGSGKPVGVALANGVTLVDALAAAVHSAAQMYPVLLIPRDLQNNLCVSTADFMQDYSDRLEGGYVYGGDSAVWSSSVGFAEQMISGNLDRNCH